MNAPARFTAKVAHGQPPGCGGSASASPARASVPAAPPASIAATRAWATVRAGTLRRHARMLMEDLAGDIGPRLARLRTAASERFDEHSRRGDFDTMISGEVPFPDE